MASDQASSQIGIIGRGHIGSIIAKHILASGRTVMGWNHRPEPIAELAREGGL